MIQYTPIKILFEIGGVKIFSWGIAVLLALLISFALFLRATQKQKIPKQKIYGIFLFSLIGVLLGSRIAYILLNFNYFYANPLLIFAVWRGGFVSYGGFLGGIFLAGIYVVKSKLDLLKLLNIAAPYIALGLAIGRIGCFLNWCCYGLASNLPWAIKVGTDIPRHPTQIYLSLAGFVVFWLLIIIKNSKIKMFSQNLFAWFLIFYSISSFIIDPLRVYPSSQYFLTFSYSQIFDILLFITAILIILSKHLYKTRTY